jgi:hypothetical protein
MRVAEEEGARASAQADNVVLSFQALVKLIHPQGHIIHQIHMTLLHLQAQEPGRL